MCKVYTVNHRAVWDHVDQNENVTAKYKSDFKSWDMNSAQNI